MTDTYHLSLQLLNGATFGRGDGVAGLVDTEVQHNARTGLPEISGRGIKGLLAEECATILYNLSDHPNIGPLESRAIWLFGEPGSRSEAAGGVHVGRGKLPAYLRSLLANSRIPTGDQLAALTSIRRQTAIDESSGAPARGTLRALRTLLPTLTFQSDLYFDVEPDTDTLALLAISAAAVKRGGLGRNRGAGKLRIRLYRNAVDILPTLYTHFGQMAA